MIAPLPQIPSFASPDCTPASKFDALKAQPINVKPDCCPTPKPSFSDRDDACEIKLTAARLEMARLRSLALEAMRCCEPCNEPAESPCPAPPADASTARRAYAPLALGEVTDSRETLPPIQPQPLLMDQQITNLGTLIDVLF